MGRGGEGARGAEGEGWGLCMPTAGDGAAREVQLDASEQPGAEYSPAIPCGAAAGVCWRCLHTGGKVGGLHAPSLRY